MEYRRLQGADQSLMRSLAREPLQYDWASDSDAVEPEPEEDSDPDSNEESKENIPPASDWLPDTHDVHSVTAGYYACMCVVILHGSAAHVGLFRLIT